MIATRILSLGGVAGVILVVHATSGDAVPREPRDRVAHHLREVDEIVGHFEAVLSGDCPRFGSSAEWNAFVDAEVDRAVSLLAHLGQAWIEAKRSPDDDVRRTAKAPRKRLDQARALIEKIRGCADDNGQTFAPVSVWRRIEREVPRRQAEIALPD